MSNEVFAALLALVGSMAGSLGGILASARLTTFLLAAAGEKGGETQQLVERMPAVEDRAKSNTHRIDTWGGKLWRRFQNIKHMTAASCIMKRFKIIQLRRERYMNRPKGGGSRKEEDQAGITIPGQDKRFCPHKSVGKKRRTGGKAIGGNAYDDARSGVSETARIRGISRTE